MCCRNCSKNRGPNRICLECKCVLVRLKTGVEEKKPPVITKVISEDKEEEKIFQPTESIFKKDIDWRGAHFEESEQSQESNDWEKE